MEQTEKHWKKMLDLYGADTDRWPERLTDIERQQLKILPDYNHARDTDRILSQTDWPEPSQNLKSMVLEQIEREERQRRDTPAFIPMAAQAAELIRPAFLILGFAFFLLAGLTSGIRYHSTTLQDKIDYSYFSLGPAYAYGAVLNEDMKHE